MAAGLEFARARMVGPLQVEMRNAARLDETLRYPARETAQGHVEAI